MSAARMTVNWDEDWPDLPGYDAIVKTFGDIFAKAEDNDYQGDSLYLIKSEQYGIVTFGWGSCSGCDALQAVDRQADLDRLQDDIERGITWYPTLETAQQHVANMASDERPTYLSDELVAEFKTAVAGLAR